MDLGLLLPEILLAATGLLAIGVDLFATNKRWVAGVSLVGLVATLAAVLSVRSDGTESWMNTFFVDGVSAVFKVIFIGVAFLAVLLSIEYVDRRRIHAGEFYALLMFVVLGMFLMASSRELLVIYLGLELLSIGSYVLIGMIKGDPASAESSIKAFLMGALNSAVLLFGISLLYGVTGTTHISGIQEAVASESVARLPLLAAMVFVIAGFGFKVAAVPFHMWVPDAYQGAPTPFSAVLIAGSEAAGFAALLRVLWTGLPDLSAQWSIILSVLAVASMTLGNLAALRQTNVKRMMAYSAIAQAGYVLAALAVATPESLSALLYYLLAYSFMTMGTFAGIVYLARVQGGEELDDFQGLGRRAPWVAFAMTAFMLSLIGIPPTAGFYGKLLILLSAIGANATGLAIAIVINSVISVGYYANLIRQMYLRPAEDTSPFPGAASIGVVLALAFLAVVLLGVLPQPVTAWIQAVRLGPGV